MREEEPNKRYLPLSGTDEPNAPGQHQMIGESIGPYTLLDLLGEGAFGIVYLAQQKQPIRRQVALKIIKPGMDSKQVIARFEVEKQALALLDHPNIAHVYDAGRTSIGRPYFVMEYVKGMSITRYCDDHKLTVEQRLKLIVQVCEAVQYAHQKGIIHRDLKPSNILVTLQSQKATPKIIDFGIAKATEHSLTQQTLLTLRDQFLGTPEYMSPEQAGSKDGDIDIRTDVYSLGVLIYELLTGTLPFDSQSLRKAACVEIQRIIREEDPPHPGKRLSGLGKDAAKIAANRGTDMIRLSKRLSRELEWIPLKAIRKEPERRYRTAHDLAHDIQNYLTGKPLEAGPESILYRWRKTLLRHRAASIIAAFGIAILLLLISLFRIHTVSQEKNKENEELMFSNAFSQAETSLSESRYPEAFAQTERCLEIVPNHLYAQILQARIRAREGKTQNAISILQPLTSQYPEEGVIYDLLTVLHLEMGNAREELHYRKLAEEHPPQTPEAYYLRAITAESLNEGLQLLSEGLALHTNSYRLLKARAQIYHNIEDFRNMEHDAVIMSHLRPQDSIAHALYAISLREQGDYVAALNEHDRAIDLSESDTPERIEWGRQKCETLFRKGEFSTALTTAQECVKLDPNDYTCRFMVYGALVALSRYEQAKSEYMKIVKYNSGAVNELVRWTCRFIYDALDRRQDITIPQKLTTHPACLHAYEFTQLHSEWSTKARRITPGVPKWGGTVSPDGKQFAYAQAGQTREVQLPQTLNPRFPLAAGSDVIDLDTGKIRSLVRKGSGPEWSPDGRYIAFNRNPKDLDFKNDELWVIPEKGGKPWLLDYGHAKGWSKDSQHVYYFSATDMYLYRKRINNPEAEAIKVLHIPTTYSPVISPCERYVAFPDSGKIRIVDVSTKKDITTWQLPAREGRTDCFVVWSPDSSEISIGDQASMGLWIYNIKDRKAFKILSGPIARGYWGPDHAKFFFSTRGFSQDVWVADIDPNMSTVSALGPGRTKVEHYQELIARDTLRLKAYPESSRCRQSYNKFKHHLDVLQMQDDSIE